MLGGGLEGEARKARVLVYDEGEEGMGGMGKRLCTT